MTHSGPLAVVVFPVVYRSLETVGEIVRCSSLVVAEAHGSVPLVVGHLALGLVHGEEVVVGAQAVTMGVSVGEEATLRVEAGRTCTRVSYLRVHRK